MMQVLDERPVYVDSLVWLPLDEYEPKWINFHKRRLSVFIKDFNPYSKVKGKRISNYRIDHEDNYIGLPIRYGLQLLQNHAPPIEYDLCEGYPVDFPRRPDPNHPNASAGQGEMMTEAIREATDNLTILIEAPTGSGKTVVGLNTIAELGKTALVIVATRQLARQWKTEAKDVLGVEDSDIGEIVEGKASYEGKKIVIAVIHNLINRDWPDELYDYFGTVIWDEAHRLGAEGFSRSMSIFAATHRIALTATPDRKDGGAKLFLDYFGDASVKGTSDALEAECRVLHLPCKAKTGMPKPRLINYLTGDELRNENVTEVIVDLYNDERRILVLSDRIDQLQVLMGMVADSGVPEDKIGLYTRSYTADNGKKRQHTDEQLEAVKADCQIIFATYGMAKEGTDIPTLDAGVEASPQSDVIQGIGRIRRPLPDKRLPLWISIADVGVPELERQTKSRLSGLRKNNVEIMNYEY